jgi:hypothetical protein
MQLSCTVLWRMMRAMSHQWRKPQPITLAYLPLVYHRGVRILVIAVVVLVLLATAALVAQLVRTVTTAAIPFDTDEANHAVDGWEVYHALAAGSPADLSRAVVRQGFYPPVHSFFVATAYAVAGPGLATSRLPTVVNFALSLALLAWLTVRLGRRQPDAAPTGAWWVVAAAACAVAFAITSPVYVSQAVLVMQEITGALLGLVLLLVVDQADHAVRKRWRWLVAAALVATTIALTKYSFGLFYLPGLILGLVTAHWPGRSDAGRWDPGIWRDVGIVLAVYGGILGLWLLVTDRTTLWLFFTDHPQYAPIFSRKNLLYLFRLWFNSYAPHAALAIIGTGLAILGAARRWPSVAVRVAVWSILAAVAVLTISPTDEPRHFLPVAPAVWLLAGLGLVEGWRWLEGSGRGRQGVASLVVLIALLSGSAIQPARRLGVSLQRQLEGRPALLALHDFALGQVDLNRPVLFIGDFNDQNTLLAIRWRAATRTGRSLWALDIDYFPFEHHEHSLNRTGRKAQIATVDPTFPRQHMNEIFARGYFAYVVEFKQTSDYAGPRASNPDDPLCPYLTVEQQVEDWIAIVYDLNTIVPDRCAG